jgi:hypothetical protein
MVKHQVILRMALHSHLIHPAQNQKNLYFSFSEVNDSSCKTRGWSNEEKIGLSKLKLQQASYTIKDELKKNIACYTGPR